MLKFNFEDMNLESFNCFKTILLYVNLKEKNLSKKNSVWANDDEFKFKCNVLPEKVIGLKECWDIVYQVKDNNVANSSSEFITKLYFSTEKDKKSETN